MEVLIILILIVLILLFSNHSSGIRRTVEQLTRSVDRMSQETEELKAEIKKLRQQGASSAITEAGAPVQEPPRPKPKPVPLTLSLPTPPPAPHPVAPAERREAPPVAEPLAAAATPKEDWWSRWLRNNPDLEKFVGENLLNKIGIAVLVLGISFFVKYAIDKNWINETGRVCIGLACGALLAGLAHYLRNTYRSFSSVLAGGGIAVFYFTIAFAFHQYQLLSQTAAFLLMVVISAFAVALALLYDKMELAVIAAVGGFLTPLMLSTGEGNYIILFTYLIILNLGLLSLSYFKRWPLVNILSLFFTEVLFAGWMFSTLPSAEVSYPLALLFATALYLIFLGMNMIHPIRNDQPFRRADFSLLLFLTATYYAAGMLLLGYVEEGKYHGLFTLAAGLLDLGLAWYFFRRANADRNLLFLLIGLTLTFLSLAIPVQLHGHTITLFWSAELVLLYWLYLRSGIRLFRYASGLITALTIISLMMDWSAANADSTSGLFVLFTDLQGIVTNTVAAAAFFFLALLLGREAPADSYIMGLTNSQVRKGSLVLATGIVYLSCIFGVNLYFSGHASLDVPNVYHRLLTEGFAIAFILWLQQRQRLPWLQLAAGGACLLYHLASLSLIAQLRNGVLDGRYSWPHLWAHWLGFLLLLFLFYRIIDSIRNNQQTFGAHYRAIAWAFSSALVLLFSTEFLHVYVTARYNAGNVPELEQQYARAVLTILWAVCSFALMWLGMKHRNKTLRIISLSIFSLALLKLFFADIRDISEGGRIAAFILLGVLLLTISFMYQKLKQIIIDDQEA